MQLRFSAFHRPSVLEPTEHVEEPHIGFVESAARAAADRLGANWRGNIEGAADVNAEEAHLGHANHVERMAVEIDGPTNDRRIAAVLLLPERMTQHNAGGRTALLIVRRSEHAADVRAYAERLEEIAADPQALRRSGLAAAGQVERHRAPGQQLGKGLLPLAHGAPQRFGHQRPPADEVPRPPFAVRVDADFDELLGMLDRQRSEPHRVHELKDRGVGSGAQRQRQDGDEGECRIETEQARAKSQILPDSLEQTDRVHLVNLLADPRGVAQLAIRGRARRLWRKSARDLIVNLGGEVRVELEPALVVPPCPTDEASPAHGSTTPPDGECG